jgi:hypothetical protein
LDVHGDVEGILEIQSHIVPVLAVVVTLEVKRLEEAEGNREKSEERYE